MLMAEAMSWPELIDRFGVSVAVLIVFSGAVAVAGVTVWRWVTPRLDKLLDAHFAFLAKLGDSFDSLHDLAAKNDMRMERLERGIASLQTHPSVGDLVEIEEKLAQLDDHVSRLRHQLAESRPDIR
ncbi:MAG TPA: hypothetical protein VD932_02560 [Aquabacterium sp.]|nr:hypothetical protein [Aquabacterium sp.]